MNIQILVPIFNIIPILTPALILILILILITNHRTREHVSAFHDDVILNVFMKSISY